MSDLDKLITIAENSYEKSLELITKEFQTHIKEKDNSPVTDVDLAMNKFIVDLIRSEFPGDVVVGEESVLDGEGEDDYGDAWFVDPIDGTKELIKGNGEWAIHIGKCRNHRPEIGVVVHPTEKMMCFASRGRGAFSKDLESGQISELKVVLDQKLENATLVKSRSFNSSKIDKIEEFLGVKNSFQQGSLGLKVCHIALTTADIYFNLSNFCRYWDLCAPEIILEEAGGACLTLDGQKVVYDSGPPFAVGSPFLAASSERLAREVIEKIQPFRPPAKS